jgi:hypothetical protein
MLEEEGIEMSNNKFSKTKRIELIDELYAIMHRDDATQEEANMTSEMTAATNLNEAQEVTNMNVNRETLASRLLNKNDKTERILYVWNIILHCDKDDVLYITTEELAQFLFDSDIVQRPITEEELKDEQVTRQKLIDALGIAAKNICQPKQEEPKFVSNALPKPAVQETPGDGVCPMVENTPAEIVYDADMSMKILEGVIRHADTNDAHNYISDWMLTSVVSEKTIGLPLKGKDENGKWTEFYKTFTDEQKAIIKAIRLEFLKRSGFKPTKNKEGKTTGYVIPAKSLIYGRHKWLGKACVYHLKDSKGVTTIYHASLNGLKNTTTNLNIK